MIMFSVNSETGVTFFTNPIDVSKKEMSLSVNPGSSVDLWGEKGLNDFPAMMVIEFLVASLNSPSTWFCSHSPTETITVTETTPITNHKILKKPLILFQRKFCRA